MRKLIPLTVYAVAMGYLESALVIYIREMIFGNPIQVFPLRLLEPRFAVLEVIREVATIVMLGTASYLAGKDRLERWMMFIYSFALWDIVYYVVLEIAVGWPASLLTMDVLFLIPVVWIGPVLAPILISILLMITSVCILSMRRKLPGLRIRNRDIWLFVAGCVVVLYSFTAQIFHILLSRGPKGLENYAPGTFDWVPFLVGFLIMCAAVTKTIMDTFHKMRSNIPGETGSEPDEVIR